MPREARVVVPGFPHHITQRGNDRQDVFFTDDDHGFYLDTLKECSEEHGLRVIGYCLMTNHIHLIAVPVAETSLAKAVGGTHLRYARHVNRLHGRSGHLWQNRFFSCPLEERHYLAALRYVDRNPVRARMVRMPLESPSVAFACQGFVTMRSCVVPLHPLRPLHLCSDRREPRKEDDDVSQTDLSLLC